jgi:hypothetical protein
MLIHEARALDRAIGRILTRDAERVGVVRDVYVSGTDVETGEACLVVDIADVTLRDDGYRLELRTPQGIYTVERAWQAPAPRGLWLTERVPGDWA